MDNKKNDGSDIENRLNNSFQTSDDNIPLSASIPTAEVSTDDENLISSSGIAPNLLASFAYLFSCFSGIIVLLIEKRSNYAIFHARQAIFIWIFITLPLYMLFGDLFDMPLFLFSLYMMYRAYNDINQMDGGFKIPVISTFAEEGVVFPWNT